MKVKRIFIACLVLGVMGLCAMFGTLDYWEKFGPPPEAVLDRVMRLKTIDALVAKLNQFYVFPEKAKKIEAILLQRHQKGTYDSIRSGYQLARQLTADIRGIAKDLHMRVGYHPKMVLPDEVDGPEPTSRAEWEQQSNLFTRLIVRHKATRGMVQTDHLDGNIGYLKLSGFPEAFLIADTYATAMDQLADTDGLIVDLRRNAGGDPESVALLISYFVDQRRRLNDIWDRETGTTVQHWTARQLDGKRYGGKKPVLILAGPDTASAGEDFAYTMQAMKRATVVGAPTWGGAHPTKAYRLGGHFIAWIPNQRSISPITHTNWEGVGVTPDIAAAPDMALVVAKNLMWHRLRGTASLVAAEQ